MACALDGRFGHGFAGGKALPAAAIHTDSLVAVLLIDFVMAPLAIHKDGSGLLLETGRIDILGHGVLSDELARIKKFQVLFQDVLPVVGIETFGHLGEGAVVDEGVVESLLRVGGKMAPHIAPRTIRNGKALVWAQGVGECLVSHILLDGETVGESVGVLARNHQVEQQNGDGEVFVARIAQEIVEVVKLRKFRRGEFRSAHGAGQVLDLIAVHIGKVDLGRAFHQDVVRINITHEDVAVVKVVEHLHDGDTGLHQVALFPAGELALENLRNAEASEGLAFGHFHEIAYGFVACVVDNVQWGANTFAGQRLAHKTHEFCNLMGGVGTCVEDFCHVLRVSGIHCAFATATDFCDKLNDAEMVGVGNVLFSGDVAYLVYGIGSSAGVVASRLNVLLFHFITCIDLVTIEAVIIKHDAFSP